jgi:outer membrane lipoprotein-sorting protein
MKFILISFVLGLFVFIGCSSTDAVYYSERILPADRLIKKLESNRRKIKFFEANGIINVNTPDFKGKSSFEVVINKPDSAKISFYGPFGIDIAHVLVTKNKLLFYDVMQDKIYVGSNDKNFLYRLFRIDLTVNDLMSALLGSVDLSERLNKEPDEYYTDKIYRLVYVDNPHAQKNNYFIEQKSLSLSGYSLQKLNGETILEAKYSDYNLLDGIPVPYSVNITNKIKNQSIDLSYRKISINSKNKSIKLQLPENINIINLD